MGIIFPHRPYSSRRFKPRTYHDLSIYRYISTDHLDPNLPSGANVERALYSRTGSVFIDRLHSHLGHITIYLSTDRSSTYHLDPNLPLRGAVQDLYTILVLMLRIQPRKRMLRAGPAQKNGESFLESYLAYPLQIRLHELEVLTPTRHCLCKKKKGLKNPNVAFFF